MFEPVLCRLFDAVSFQGVIRIQVGFECDPAGRRHQLEMILLQCNPDIFQLSISFQHFGNLNDPILELTGIEVSVFGGYFCKRCSIGSIHVALMQGCI